MKRKKCRRLSISKQFDFICDICSQMPKNGRVSEENLVNPIHTDMQEDRLEMLKNNSFDGKTPNGKNS